MCTHTFIYIYFFLTPYIYASALIPFFRGLWRMAR